MTINFKFADTKHYIAHRNTWKQPFSDKIMRWFLRLPLPKLILVCLVCNVCAVLIFAIVYWLFGEECYAAWDEFTFHAVLSLSVHTFTTVGFGSIYPICSGVEMVVLIQNFFALCLGSVLVAGFMNQVLEPKPMIRFSKKVLVNWDSEGTCVLQWCIIPAWSVAKDAMNSELFNVNVKAFANLMFHGDDGKVVGGNVVDLPLQTSWTGKLYSLDLEHRVDESSPLHGKLESLLQLGVMVSAFDSQFGKESTTVHMYTVGSGDFIQNAKWECIWDFDDPGAWFMDHAKFDSYTTGAGR